MIANPIPYKIVSDRLILRCYEPSDIHQLNEKTNRSKEHLLPWLSWAKEAPYTLEMHVNTIRRMRSMYDTDQDYTLGIFDKNTGELLGGTGMHTVSEKEFHIGYWIDIQHQKKGYITEAVKALTQVGLLYRNMHFVQVCNAKENSASRNIPLKLGFTLEATLSKRLKLAEDDYRDKEIWSMDKVAFLTNKAMQMKIVCYDFMGNEIYNTTV